MLAATARRRWRRRRCCTSAVGQRPVGIAERQANRQTDLTVRHALALIPIELAHRHERRRRVRSNRATNFGGWQAFIDDESTDRGRSTGSAAAASIATCRLARPRASSARGRSRRRRPRPRRQAARGDQLGAEAGRRPDRRCAGRRRCADERRGASAHEPRQVVGRSPRSARRRGARRRARRRPWRRRNPPRPRLPLQCSPRAPVSTQPTRVDSPVGAEHRADLEQPDVGRLPGAGCRRARRAGPGSERRPQHRELLRQRVRDRAPASSPARDERRGRGRAR